MYISYTIHAYGFRIHAFRTFGGFYRVYTRRGSSELITRNDFDGRSRWTQSVVKTRGLCKRIRDATSVRRIVNKRARKLADTIRVSREGKVVNVGQKPLREWSRDRLIRTIQCGGLIRY